MRRWDRLIDGYVAEYRARGIGAATVSHTRAGLERWGRWLKPAPAAVDRADRRRADRALHRQLRDLPGQGHGLRDLQRDARLRGLPRARGPMDEQPDALDARAQGHPVLTAAAAARSRRHAGLWREADNRRGACSPHLWLTVLALLYGTGLRRGELGRLDLGCFDQSTARSGSMVVRPAWSAWCRCRRSSGRASRRTCRAGTTGSSATPRLASGRCWSAAWQAPDGADDQQRDPPARTRSRRHGREPAPVPAHLCVRSARGRGPPPRGPAGARARGVIATTVRYAHLADPLRREAIDPHPLNAWLSLCQGAAWHRALDPLIEGYLSVPRQGQPQDPADHRRRALSLKRAVSGLELMRPGTRRDGDARGLPALARGRTARRPHGHVHRQVPEPRARPPRVRLAQRSCDRNVLDGFTLRHTLRESRALSSHP